MEISIAQENNISYADSIDSMHISVVMPLVVQTHRSQMILGQEEYNLKEKNPLDHPHLTSQIVHAHNMLFRETSYNDEKTKLLLLGNTANIN